MTVALVATIWIALVALLLGELGRRRNRQTRVTTRWAIVCSSIGVVFTAVHILIALGYGVARPFSLYVNYGFLAWWLMDTMWWWRATPSFLVRSPIIDWGWRLTAFIMVVNGAIIFASPIARIAGVLMAIALVFVWWHSPSQRQHSSNH